MNYLLDSSAWLAHLFGEAGAQEITAFFKNPQNRIYLSVLSIPEIYTRLRMLDKTEEWEHVWSTYTLLFTQILPVTELVAHQSIIVRKAASTRLPTIDGLIAATALVHQVTLVHRDPHFAAIPETVLRQIKLPEK